MNDRAAGVRGSRVRPFRGQFKQRAGAAPGAWTLLALGLALLAGCHGAPRLLDTEQQGVIDRSIIEYPAGTELRPLVQGLTGPVAIAFDGDGTLLVAEGGFDGRPPRVYAFKPDGSFVDIYPKGRQLPFNLGGEFRMYGPVGGLAVAGGKIFVSHRDGEDRGVITAFNYDGTHKTIVSGLPARGDFAVTDLAVAPNGRLFFGVGAATNSGVVGIDNLYWLRQHRAFCDKPWTDLYLLGRRFNTPNPFAGLFGGTDIAVTAPFQPFGKSIETRIEHARDDKPTAAVYSVDQDGGNLRVEAHGIRYPAGLGFSSLGSLFFTNQGMKHRGTRPVKNDPDVILRWVQGQWYGWPDFTAHLQPVREPQFQPEERMIVESGYRDLSFLLDHSLSRLTPPNPRGNLLVAQFLPYSGAAKFDFAPASGYFSRLRQGANVVIVALSGDRAAQDAVGVKLKGPIGYRVVQANLDDGTVSEFIRNVREGPRSRHRKEHELELERPVDVKFGPDGALYILDMGELEIRKGRLRVPGGTGKIYKLVGVGQ